MAIDLPTKHNYTFNKSKHNVKCNGTAMPNFIELSNVSRTFGELKAVNNISLDVAKGQVLGFLGPNGAGKTTTMRMITGFLEPTSGSIKILGHDMSTEPLKCKESIGYLPEGAPLYNDLSGRMFLNFIGQARGLSKNKLKERLDYVISTLHLEQVIDRAIDTLSKGYKRRVALAQAILHDPDVLILDEPTDGLDPIQKNEVRGLIKQMAPHKAIIISTHILEEVDAVCDRAIIINRGVIVANDTPSGLVQNHPMHGSVKLVIRHTEPEKVITILQQDPAVKRVSHQLIGDLSHFTIIAKSNQDISRSVNNLSHEHKWDIQSLSLLQGNLDEVFTSLVTTTSNA